MGLTDPSTKWVAVAVAVLAAVVVVTWWRRLGRRGVRFVLARAAALLGVQALALVAVFVVVNAQFGLFSGWDDLLGTQGVATSTTIRADAAVGAAPVRLDGYDGRVWQVVVPGPRSGTAAQALVVLPSGYGTTPAPAGGYPVLEALHGWPGTTRQWLDAMDLLPSLDAAVAKHQMAESVVVIPSLEVPAGRDTECVDGAAGQPQLETWLSQDVPDWLEGHYAVSRQPASWSTIGLSMGGWCANALAMLHPDRFGNAISFGGYAQLDLGDYKPFAADSAAARRYDLVALARTNPPAVKLWALSSQRDELSWPSTQALAQAVHGATSMTAVVQQHGGHRTSIWAGLVPDALTWLGSNGSGFAPTA